MRTQRIPCPTPRRAATACALAVATAMATGCGSRNQSVLADLRNGVGDPDSAVLERYDADTRRSAIQSVAESEIGGEEVYLRTYRQTLADPDATVRAASIRALGEHGHPDDVRRIVPRLEDDSDFVRWEAAKALEKLHHPAAVVGLIDALDDDDVDVRMAAARALGQYAEPRVFDALVGVLNDIDYAVARAAIASLRTLTGQDFGRDGRAWIEWAQAHREDLFEQGEAFTYRPFEMPPGFIDRNLVDPLLFWRDEKPPEERKPTGL